jgi:hypothetical protein
VKIRREIFEEPQKEKFAEYPVAVEVLTGAAAGKIL